jgi:hypothetical protein
MIAGDVEEFALVTDLVNLVGVGEDALPAVADDRAILPATLKQLVEHFDVFGRDFIAVIVPAQSALPNVLGTALQVRRDDVPADASLGVMISGR